VIERLGKWLAVEERLSESGKTSIFALSPIAGGRPVGFIGWYGPWRKYALQPEPDTVFEQDCLRAIADFCEAKTRAHREQLKAARG
jgi:hypothetical protein